MANMQIGIRQTIFSKHAQRRLSDRHIQFDHQAMEKLNAVVLPLARALRDEQED